MNLDALNVTVRRMGMAVVAFAGISSVVTLSSMYALIKAQATLERATNERPVMVVPGAVAGEYVAGLSAENLKGAARYVAQLGTSFTPANFKARMDELKTYTDAPYLPALSNDIKSLEMEAQAQAQGRFFIADSASENLAVISPNLFEYTATGPWVFTAGGLPLAQDSGSVTVRFKLGLPSEKNKYGFQLVKFSAIRTKGGA